MAASYSASVAPGTAANKKRQAKDYIRFALQYKVPYLSPSITHVCMYAQRLANTHASPNSIKNYISGAKSWVGEHQGNTWEPLGAHHVRTICTLLDSSPSAPLAIKPALLIGFSCFLRSSNILSPTISQWGGPHTLLAGDIRPMEGALSVFIRSSKTRPVSEGLSFTIPRSEDPRYCPVLAWRRYVGSVRPWALGPAFIHLDRTPVTPNTILIPFYSMCFSYLPWENKCNLFQVRGFN